MEIHLNFGVNAYLLTVWVKGGLQIAQEIIRRPKNR
jgi:hypothetical protein